MAKTYEVQEPVQAWPCYHIIATYDGQAPDTYILSKCSTLDLAKEVCDLLNVQLQGNDNVIEYAGKSFVDGSYPYCEGYQSARRFEVCPVSVTQNKSEIRTSVEDVLTEDFLCACLDEENHDK